MAWYKFKKILTRTPVMTKVSDIGERQLINRISAILDIKSHDDCAIISFAELMGSNAVAADNNDMAQQHNPTPSIVLTTDMLHRTTDFPDGMPYTDIGWMSVAAVSYTHLRAHETRHD